jgi:hypothetical protein
MQQRADRDFQTAMDRPTRRAKLKFSTKRKDNKHKKKEAFTWLTIRSRTRAA